VEIDAVKLIVRNKTCGMGLRQRKRETGWLGTKKRRKKAGTNIAAPQHKKKHNDTQRDKEIQEQGTKAVSSGTHSL
jgi:hypothetical protein